VTKNLVVRLAREQRRVLAPWQNIGASEKRSLAAPVSILPRSQFKNNYFAEM